jgi:hypothetical protein
MGATVTLAVPVVRVEPGQEASVELRLRNTGSVVDEFTFDVLGPSGAWATVEPPTISLFPGAEGAAKIVFRPPRHSTTEAGAITYGLRAASREDPEGSYVEEGTVEVGSYIEPYAELVPRTSRGSRGASHDLAVDNRGNVRLNATVEAADADRLLSFDVAPPSVVVEPGEAGFSKVRVSPVKRFWRGQSKTRPFQLQVTPEGYQPITLDGALLQEAILPPWFMRAMLALLAAIILLVMLWLLVLRPTIESAATDAVASPIAALRNDANAALAAAGIPTMPTSTSGAGASAGASAAASAAASSAASAAASAAASSAPPSSPLPSGASAPPPTTPPPSAPPATTGPFQVGLGNLVDGSLDRNATSIRVTGTLFITDLVFSNPLAREGAMVLLRDDQPLLRLRLENFRDLDFHFVTPIVVTAGHTLNLSLACAPSAGSSTTGSAPCDPAVYYSGYLRP